MRDTTHAATHANMKSLYASVVLPDDAIRPTWEPLVPAEKQGLLDELTTSNYINRAIALNHFSQVGQRAVWRFGGFRIDLWDTVAAMEAWGRKMPFLLRRLETVRLYYRATKPIHFICVPLDAPRHLPAEPGKCLEKHHVNGGYTYLNGDKVYLFRKEELPKVLIHEYLHQIQGHKDPEWATGGALDTLRATLGLAVPDLRPNESVVEYWAVRHHCTLLSIETGIPWNTLWDAERAFLFRQAKAIWAHQQACAATWTEGTPVFSYYILKAMYVRFGDAAEPAKPTQQAKPAKQTKSVPWRLDYSVPELTAWIQTHWPLWKKELEGGVSTTGSRGKTARMTLLGDL